MRHHWRRYLIAVVLLALPLAGCARIVSSVVGVRPGNYKIRPVETVRVAMSDGVKLATDLYLPRAEGPFPVVLIRTPYSKGKGDNFIAKSLAKRGYAVVIQDVRGRYQSEGRWEPFLNEGPDGAKTVDWIRKRGWCSGKVGLFGMSYFGFTSWQAAAYAGSKVDALVPTLSGSSIYDVLYRQGVFVYSTGGHWGLGNAGRTAAQSLDFRPGSSFKPPLINTDNRAGRDLGFFNDWVRHEQFDNYWKPASAEGRWGKIDAPALIVGGWYDIFGGSALEDWQKITKYGATKARRESKLVMGPWNHSFSSKMQGVNFGRDVDFVDFTKYYVQWYDEHLMGSGETDLPRVRVFTTGRNDWQSLKDWPPPDADTQRWYLHSGGQASQIGDGELSRKKPGGEATDRFRHDPNNLVPTKGGALYPPGNAGPSEISGQGRRSDVLVYTTERFSSDKEITGPIKARLWITADTPDVDLAVWLLDVDEDGDARILVDGIARARYRDGGSAKWLSSTSPVAVEVDLWGISHEVEKGHKLRLHVAGSNYPRFAPNPCTRDDPAQASRLSVANVRVYHDGDHPSYVTLSVR
jgi:uncharacterized protein